MNRIALAVAFLVVAAGCSSGSDPDPTQRALHGVRQASVATVTQDGLEVTLFTDTQLETGLTPVWIGVKNAAGQQVTDAKVKVMPMMAMAGPPPFEHSAPVAGCEDAPLDAEGLYHCDVVFQMMTTPTGGAWRVEATIARPGAAAVEVSIPVAVAPCSLATPQSGSGCSAVFTYTDPNTQVATRYVASLNLVASPRFPGLNPVAVTLHTRSADMMSFPAVENATVTLDPQMPSMGHGSPGSVNPTMTSPGVYEGELSLSMDGPWETKVTFVVNGVTVGEPVFKMTF